MKAWWSRLSRRSKIIVSVVGVIVLLAAVGSASGGRTGEAGASPTPGTALASATPAVTATLTDSSEPTDQATPEPTPEPTPEVTPEPTPEPTPEAAFTTIKLSGRGSKVPQFTLPEEPAIATITNKGSSNFAVWSLGADGTEQDLLVNEIGNYSGKVLFNLDSHSAAFKVESNGSWTITISPVASAARRWVTTEALTGKGDDVIFVLGDVTGLMTTNVTHTGSSNFAVYSESTTSGKDLLINEIGNYKGEVPLPDGTVLIEVTADGSWSFSAPK